MPMETLINKSIPEFAVTAFVNGEFKTITQRRSRRKMVYILLLPCRFHFCVPYRIA